MTTEKPLTREERLAAKLRENLKRRKVQARTLRPQDRQADGREDSAPPLSKPGPSS